VVEGVPKASGRLVEAQPDSRRPAPRKGVLRGPKRRLHPSIVERSRGFSVAKRAKDTFRGRRTTDIDLDLLAVFAFDMVCEAPAVLAGLGVVDRGDQLRHYPVTVPRAPSA